MSTAGVLVPYEPDELMEKFGKLIISTSSKDTSAQKPESDEKPALLVNYNPKLQNLACVMRKHHNNEETLSIKQCNMLALLCAQEIQALHEKGLVHGKINPWNFLVQIDGENIKVSLSEIDISPSDSMKDYSAPELKRGQPPSFASDIYAYGCVLNAFRLLNMGRRFDYLYKQMCNTKAAKHPELRKPLASTIDFFKEDGFSKLSRTARLNK